MVAFYLSLGVVALGGERVIYDSFGKAHRIPDVDYVPPAVTGGIVPKFVQSPQPMQLISPFAGREYGYGNGMVSWSKQTGKPKGFIFFSVRGW